MASGSSDAPTQDSRGSGATTLGGGSSGTPAYISDRHQQAGFTRGQIVGGCFRVEEVLGAGGMGVVYRATHLTLDRVVALKVHRGGSPSDRRRLEAEARAMARLAHPNVVGVYDVRAADEGLFIAMEFIDGVHARAWLGARKRSLVERLGMCLQAGEGLAAAHAAGLVHRDFKPENVLVSRTGRVAVADFGLATAPGNPGEVVGTPAYMAPEQFAAGAVDARTDQFAFCVLLHEALYGVRPFAGRSPAQLAFETAEGRVVTPPRKADVPAEMHAVIVRGLRPDPAQRYATIGALLGELRAVMQAPAKRGVALAVGLAVAVVLVVAVAGFVAYRWIEDARARAVATPQLQRLRIGDEVSREAIAHQHALLLDAEQKHRRAQALEKVAAGDMMSDPEGYAAALAQAVDDDASVESLMQGILAGVEKSQAERDDDPYQLAAWDGRSTLVCGMNQSMEVRGVTARIAEGPAIDAQMNCRIRIVDCDIEAETIVFASMARSVHVEGGRFVATKHFVLADVAGAITIDDVQLEKPTGGAAVTIGMRGNATIAGSTLRGATALAVGMHAQVEVQDSTLVGSAHAIEAEMHSKVTLRDTRVEGAIERGQAAIVEIAQ